MNFIVEKHLLYIVSRRKYVLSNKIDPIKVCIYIFYPVYEGLRRRAGSLPKLPGVDYRVDFKNCHLLALADAVLGEARQSVGPEFYVVVLSLP